MAGHLPIASVMSSSGFGQLLDLWVSHKGLASYDLEKHGQAGCFLLLLKGRPVQSAEHVVDTVGVMMLVYPKAHHLSLCSFDVLNVFL